MAEDISPCAIISVSAPLIPHAPRENIPDATILICPTEEYAISAFRSVCRRHIILVVSAPHTQQVIRGKDIDSVDGVANIGIVRARPYPPNFSSIAARIMEPAIGASTWAFGNHKWNPYIGIFIVKAIKQNNHHREVNIRGKVFISFDRFISGMDMEEQKE